MDENEKTILKAWIINTAFRFDQDVIDAREDFKRSENSWLAFRLAVASERKSVFDTLTAQLYAILNL